MVRLKRDLVLQLVAEQGRFWQLVQEVRQLRNIVPKTQVPPADFFSRGKMLYQRDVYRIRDEVIPEAYYRVSTFPWPSFIYACLVHQPPRESEKMREFADFGPGPNPHTFIAPGLSAAQSPRMVAPPIREVRGADDKWHYEIRVDEHTTEEDVRQAYRKVASIRKEASRGGRPKRDQFVAVQCAIIHDEANPLNQADGRKRRWTYKRLAERFELESARAAEAHVKLGRAILRKETPLQ
jgi:hypothetical protein